MPLSDFPKHDRPKIIWELLDLMRHKDLSTTDAAIHLFKDISPHAIARAETILDELWDLKLCACMGEFRNYGYALTTLGKQYLVN